MKLYGLFGTGGCARDIMPLVQQWLEQQQKLKQEHMECVFVDSSFSASVLNDCRVISDSEFFAYQGEKFFNVAISQANIRQRLAEQCIAAAIHPFSIHAPNHVNLGYNQIAEGAIFSPFTMVTTNITIGKYFHANMYSYVAHDCVIGDYVTFAPNVHCNGNVVVEDYAYIGAGALIKHGLPGNPIVIGRGAVVGMGAVVTKSVPAFTTVVGNPACALVK